MEKVWRHLGVVWRIGRLFRAFWSIGLKTRFSIGASDRETDFTTEFLAPKLARLDIRLDQFRLKLNPGQRHAKRDEIGTVRSPFLCRSQNTVNIYISQNSYFYEYIINIKFIWRSNSTIEKSIHKLNLLKNVKSGEIESGQIRV